MNSLDIGILLIATLFFIRGIFRGFVFELVTVVGLILGYIISITYLSLLAGYFLSFFPTAPQSIVNLISFFLLFVGTNLLLRMVANIITKTLKIAMLGWLNRLLGGVLGMFKSIIIMSILVFIIDLIPFSSTLLEQVEVQTSELYPILNALGPRLYAEIQKITAIILPG
jgi:membrane protein required for colicin V production